MKTFNRLTLKLMEFDCCEADQFAAILFLAGRGLHHEWKVVSNDEEEADFFIFPQKPSEWPSLSGSPSAHCLFYANDDTDDNHILIDNSGLPRLNSLIRTLNKAGEGFAPALPRLGFSENKIPMATKHTDVPLSAQTGAIGIKPFSNGFDGAFFDSHAAFSPQGLLKLLLASKTACVLIKIDNTCIGVDGTKGFYYSSLTLEKMALFFSSEKFTAPPLTKQINPSEFQQMVSQAQLPPRSLNGLIWYAALNASQGRLLEGESPEDIVHLLRWPDLGIPGCGNYVKLAAFMHSNMMKLADIATATRYSTESVYNFYNACHLIGLTKKCDAVQRYQKTVDTGQRQLLEKIRDRITA